jgi:hypothetical protein
MLFDDDGNLYVNTVGAPTLTPTDTPTPTPTP